jgi:hypothetical protein
MHMEFITKHTLTGRCNSDHYQLSSLVDILYIKDLSQSYLKEFNPDNFKSTITESVGYLVKTKISQEIYHAKQKQQSAYKLIYDNIFILNINCFYI